MKARIFSALVAGVVMMACGGADDADDDALTSDTMSTMAPAPAPAMPMDTAGMAHDSLAHDSMNMDTTTR